MDFKYGSAGQANHTADTDVFGNTSGSGDASGGLYGAGKFGYSINDKAVTAVEVNADGSGKCCNGFCYLERSRI